VSAPQFLTFLAAERYSYPRNVFQCERSGDSIRCVSTAPEFRSLVWSWNGGRLCEIHLKGHSVSAVVSVPYCWESGRVLLEFTPEALSTELGEIYSDPEQRTATVEEIAHS
jgi:hypothetical protein